MRRESGDTLVEVLIAIAILAMAVVGGLGVMNFGFGVVLNAVGRTEVQAAVSSQLSLIQYSRDAYARNGRNGTIPGGAAVWEAIKGKVTTTYSSNVCNDDASPATGSLNEPFYVKEDGNAPLGEAPTKANGYASAGNGLWVEAVQPPGANYIDFYVKACWEPVAGSNNEESRSTMRLYAP